MRVRAAILLCLAGALIGVPALAQTTRGTTGNIEGIVFLEDGTGGDDVVFVRAYNASNGRFVKGVCVDGYRFVIAGLEPGRYNVRFGFGCGGTDRPPFEWWDLEGGTDGIDCAVLITVSAGYRTEGIHATVNRTSGPRNRCSPTGTPRPGNAGVQRPITGATGIAASTTPTDEIPWTGGYSPTPPPATPVGTIIGVSAGAVVALFLFGFWLYRRVTVAAMQPTSSARQAAAQEGSAERSDEPPSTPE